MAEHGEDLLAVGIDGHREIGARARHRPRRDLLARGAIDDGDLVRVRHIDVDPAARGVELEALGMRLQGNVGELRLGRGVDHRERAAAIADIDAVRRRVDADVVGIVLEVDASGGRELGAAEEGDGAVPGIGDIERVGRRNIADALRLAQSFDPAQQGACFQIDHAEAVIAQLGDEQPLAREIDGEMVDAAADFSERDLGLELERRGLGRPTRRADRGDDKGEDARDPPHFRPPIAANMTARSSKAVTESALVHNPMRPDA